jgi:polyisoprenoid-binding protein YceI
MIDTALAGEWILDASRSTVSLTSKSMAGLATVKGAFRQVTGEGTIAEDGTVGGTLTIAAASIDTRNPKRDKHLRSADFFDSANHPDITFAVAAIRPASQGVTVLGNLGIRGQERPLTFDATAVVHADREVQLVADVRVNRADFGLTWNVLGLMSMKSILTVHAVFTRR